MGYSHRDEFLDSLVGKRVKVTLFNDTKFTGTLKYDEKVDKYRLTNAINERRGFPTGDVVFRKSHLKEVKA